MKLALITSPPGSDSRAGQYATRLAPYLREEFELELHSGPELPVINPREVDQILYMIGDHADHAFCLPLLSRLGGIVDLYDWNLFELSRAAFPALDTEGLRATWIAMREGGFGAKRQLTAWRSGEETPLLNRSVVRRADGFIVGGEELKTRLLTDRNEPTPIAVIERGSKPTGEVVARYVEALRAFPTHRSGRKSVIKNWMQAEPQGDVPT